MTYTILKIDEKTNLIQVSIVIDSVEHIRYFNVNSYIELKGLEDDIANEALIISQLPKVNVVVEVEKSVNKSKEIELPVVDTIDTN